MTQEVQSKRGQRLRQIKTLTPMEQIRMKPDGVTGAWSYYLRPDGATIRDALILYPNGGIPDSDNPKMRAKYGTNAEYYQQRQKVKGFEYLGQNLTEAAMKRLVEVLAANAEDEVLFCQEQIADCEGILANSDLPAIRDQARRRRDQFKKRIEYIEQELDPEALSKELNEIARAQQLAGVDPNILRVMKAMIGEVSDSLAAKIARFQQGKPDTEEGQPRRRGRPIKGGDTEAFVDV